MCLCSCTPCEGIHAQVTSQGGGVGVGVVYGGREGGAGGGGWGAGAGGWGGRGLGVGDRNWTGAGRAGLGAGGWDTAATHPRHTRTLRERLRTLRERFSDDPWSTIGPLDPNL